MSILHSMPSNKEVRLLRLIAVAVLATVLVWGLARAKLPVKAASAALSSQRALKIPAVSVLPALTLTGKQGSVSVKLSAPLWTSATNRPNSAIVLASPTESAQLSPGLYKTDPFAALVIVPDPKFDDAMVIKPPSGEFSILSSKPELRFIRVAPPSR